MDEIGSQRVWRAILKLSRGRPEEIKKLTQCARRDYRDVLMWAENPISEKESKRMVRELQDWLSEQGVKIELPPDEGSE